MIAVNSLPAPYDRAPDPAGIAPQPETISLVQSQIDALLGQTPSFYRLPAPDRERMRAQLTRIGAYAAELVRDDWSQSRRLGQTPLIRQDKTYRGHPAVAPVARAAARTMAARADLRTAATGRVAEITQSTLRAIAFPTFVADLINGTFDAIIGATIKQMKAFQELVENVSKSIDEFMRDNITDNQARDFLVQSFPELMQLDTSADAPRIAVTPAGEEAGREQLSGLQRQLGLPNPVSSLDEDVIDETLVPAARRRLAQSRLQMLSSMVMLGLQRIVVRQGRIRATMGFHIDASDRAHAEQASTFDFAHQNSVQGMFYVAFSARTSVAYVRSTRSDSDSAINVQADLTGEVDLTFETDYLPLNRLARQENIDRIRGNSPNPDTNYPVNQAAQMTRRTATGPSAAQVVSDRIAAHGREPAPSISGDLIRGAAGAGQQLLGAVGGGGGGGAAPAAGSPAAGTPATGGGARTPAASPPPASGAAAEPATGSPPAGTTPPASTPAPAGGAATPQPAAAAGGGG